MVALLATAIFAIIVLPAAATTIGALPASGATNTSCGPFTVWQLSPSQAQATPTVVTS
jgi:hypothetical protein